MDAKAIESFHNDLLNRLAIEQDGGVSITPGRLFESRSSSLHRLVLKLSHPSESGALAFRDRLVADFKKHIFCSSAMNHGLLLWLRGSELEVTLFDRNRERLENFRARL